MNLKTNPLEIVPRTLEARHHIRKSQDHYEHIGTFLQVHLVDPAVKVFFFLTKQKIMSLTNVSNLQLGFHTEAKITSSSLYQGTCWQGGICSINMARVNF